MLGFRGNKTIEIEKDRIINTSLVVASVVGTIVYLISLNRLYTTGFHLSFIVDFITIALIVIATIFRYRLGSSLKALILITLIFIYSLIDSINYGLLSAVRVYLILIPLFSIIYHRYWQTMLVFGICIASIFSVGYLHYINLLSIPSSYNPQIYVLRYYPWVINGLNIAVVAIIILIVLRKVLGSYTHLVSDLESINQRISESERNYREIFNSSSDSIFIHNLDGTIFDVNESMLNLYGYTKGEVVETNFLDYSSSDKPFSIDEAKQLFLKANRDSNLLYEWKGRKKSGEEFWVEIALRRTLIGGEDRLIALVRDVHDKKMNAIELENYRDKLELMVKERTEEIEAVNEELTAANEELYRQREELESTLNKLHAAQNQLIQSEKLASLGIMAAGIAHEINNPLNFINGGVLGLESFIKKNIPQRIDEIQPLIDGVNVGIMRASNIVSSLDSYGQRESLGKRECEIHTIIDRCLHMFGGGYGDRICIEKHYSVTTLTVNANEMKLLQAFQNIITNAFEAIEGEGKLLISTQVRNKKAIITIADSGCGIDPSIINRITDPFFTTKQSGDGIGLGLAIADRIIQQHLGTMEFKSVLDVGTKVIINLPM